MIINTLISLYIQVFAESPFKITNGSVTATSLLSKVGNTPKKTNMAKDKQTKKIKTTKCQKSLKISTSPDFLLNNSVAYGEPPICAQPERVEGQQVKDLSEVFSMFIWCCVLLLFASKEHSKVVCSHLYQEMKC